MTIILDCEVYANYFAIGFKKHKTDKTIIFEHYDGQSLGRSKVKTIMDKHLTVSFNGLGYDLLIIALALRGASCQQLKSFSDKIIKSKIPSWKLARDAEINIPQNWQHIDLMEIAPGKVGLKLYAARIGSQNIQDLPIEPDELIEADQREVLRKYLKNDLAETERLFDKLTPQIKLRSEMSKVYGIDLRSKSDAQIAETVLMSEMGEVRSRKKAPDFESFKYRNPGIISFHGDDLRGIFKKILSTDFTLAGNGSVALPKWLKDKPIRINNTDYQMGVGGLHSCEKCQYIEAKDGWRLMDFDVASYYPNIILQQKMSPGQFGDKFCRVYEKIVERRIQAKRAGDKVTADTLKIVVNSSFGKLGSKYSPLYAPELLIQTTITGQLALLMLIERMELVGVRVVSANTDGIVCYVPPSVDDVDVEAIAFDWMLDTSYELERTDYKLLASRDVNNYVAVKLDGSAKGKGCFAATGLSKNPDTPIVYNAVMAFLASGTPLAETIYQCDDILDMCMVRRVTGGAVYLDEPVGKTCRYYWSKSAQPGDAIRYKLNGNTVPNSDGAKPAMRIDNAMLDDVDRERYVAKAKVVLKGAGYA